MSWMITPIGTKQVWYVGVDPQIPEASPPGLHVALEIYEVQVLELIATPHVPNILSIYGTTMKATASIYTVIKDFFLAVR